MPKRIQISIIIFGANNKLINKALQNKLSFSALYLTDETNL